MRSFDRLYHHVLFTKDDRRSPSTRAKRANRANRANRAKRAKRAKVTNP